MSYFLHSFGVLSDEQEVNIKADKTILTKRNILSMLLPQKSRPNWILFSERPFSTTKILTAQWLPTSFRS